MEVTLFKDSGRQKFQRVPTEDMKEPCIPSGRNKMCVYMPHGDDVLGHTTVKPYETCCVKPYLCDGSMPGTMM